MGSPSITKFLFTADNEVPSIKEHWGNFCTGKKSTSLVILAGGDLAFIKSKHTTRSTGEVDITYGPTQDGPATAKSVPLKGNDFKMLISNMLGGVATMAATGHVLETAHKAFLQTGEWYMKARVIKQGVAGEWRSMGIKDIALSLLLPVWSPTPAEEADATGEEEVPADEAPTGLHVPLEAYPRFLALLTTVQLADEESKRIKTSDLKLVIGDFTTTTLPAILKRADTYAGGVEGQKALKALKALSDLNIEDFLNNPEAAAESVRGYAPLLCGEGRRGVADKEAAKRTGKKKKGPTPAKGKRKKKGAQEEDDDSDGSSVDESDSSSEGEKAPGGNNNGPQPPKKKGKAETSHPLVPDGIEAAVALSTFFSGSVALAMRKLTGVEISPLPTNSGELKALGYYYKEAVATLESHIGTTYREDIDVVSMDDVYMLRAKASVALTRSSTQGEGSTSDAPDKIRRRPDEDEGDCRSHKDAKYNKELTGNSAVQAITAATNATLIAAMEKETFKSHVQDILHGEQPGPELIRMEAGDRAASTRLFMSNGKCDAAGETDPALAHIPRALRDALTAAAAFQSLGLRRAVGDAGSEMINLVTAEKLIEDGLRGNYKWEDYTAAARELKGAAKLQQNTHPETNAAWIILEEVLTRTCQSMLALPHAAEDIQTFRKNVNQTAQSNFISVEMRGTYTKRVLDAWNGAITAFRSGRSDRLPSLQSDALRECDQFYAYEKMKGSLAHERNRDKPPPKTPIKPKTPGKPQHKAPLKPPGTPTAPVQPGAPPGGGADPNRPANGHATKSGWKTRKYIADIAVLNKLSDDFRTKYPDVCTSYNLRACNYGSTCKFKHEVPADMQAFADAHSLEMTF